MILRKKKKLTFTVYYEYKFITYDLENYFLRLDLDNFVPNQDLHCTLHNYYYPFVP